MMDHNVGPADRYIRIALGSLLLATGAARLATRPDAGSAALGLLGGTMLAEGVLGTCPLYSLAGISTADEPPPGYRTNDVIQPYEGI